MQTTTDSARLIADISISLDGFVADENDGIDRLVGWMFSGGTEVPTPQAGLSFRTSEGSAGVLRDALTGVGALLSGRRNFDLAGGWGGTHPMGVPVFVVTHEAPAGFEEGSIRFVTDGLESAVEQAKAAAGGKIVGVATPSLTRQLLAAGLLDAIHLNVVPVLLGSGVPFFAGLTGGPYALGDPDIVAADGVTHLTYEVQR
jgi:dihydrofolate reductase